jgi:hypothetical protein
VAEWCVKPVFFEAVRFSQTLCLPHQSPRKPDLDLAKTRVVGTLAALSAAATKKLVFELQVLSCLGWFVNVSQKKYQI